MKKLGLFLLLFGLWGCEKPNPTPELTDGIYSDLNSRAEAVQKSVESERKKLEGFKKDLEKAKPNTGDTAVAQKRYFETERKIASLEQEAHYLELHADSRRVFVRKSYIQAFNAKKPWNNDTEVESYASNRKLNEKSPDWDENVRIQAYQKQMGYGNSANIKKTEGEKPPAPKNE
jgi:hypothetical protein